MRFPVLRTTAPGRPQEVRENRAIPSAIAINILLMGEIMSLELSESSRAIGIHLAKFLKISDSQGLEYQPELDFLKNFTFNLILAMNFAVLSLHENKYIPESDRGRLRWCLGILRNPTGNPKDACLGISPS